LSDSPAAAPATRVCPLPLRDALPIPSISANGSGQIGWSFTPACTDATGNYTLWCVDANTGRQSNNVTETVTSNPSCNSVTLSISESSRQQLSTTLSLIASNFTCIGTV